MRSVGLPPILLILSEMGSTAIGMTSIGTPFLHTVPRFSATLV